MYVIFYKEVLQPTTTKYADGVSFSHSDDIHVDSKVQWYYIFVIFILISTPTKNLVINDILKSNTLRFLKQCYRTVVLVDPNTWVHHTGDQRWKNGSRSINETPKMVQKQNYIIFLLHLCLGWKLKAEEGYLNENENCKLSHKVNH